MSKEGKIYEKTMKAVKPIINGMNLKRKRTGHNILGVLKGVPKEIMVEPAIEFPLPAEWIIPPESTGEKTILFIHGGSYLTGTLLSSRPVAGLLSQTMGCRVLTFEYGLAPEQPYPAALNDAVKLWEYLTKSIAPKDITVVGESAGGGLSLALCLYLRDHGMELPMAIVTLSAWTDLTITSKSHQELEKTDPVISSDELRIAALKYSFGECLKEPYISPIFGDFRGFCPVLIHVGSKEVLLEDSTVLYERIKEAGVNVKLSVYDGMWHVWHGFDVPESKAALNEINEFLKQLYGDGGSSEIVYE